MANKAKALKEAVARQKAMADRIKRLREELRKEGDKTKN